MVHNEISINIQSLGTFPSPYSSSSLRMKTTKNKSNQQKTNQKPRNILFIYPKGKITNPKKKSKKVSR